MYYIFPDLDKNNKEKIIFCFNIIRYSRDDKKGEEENLEKPKRYA